jgi:hypothetical protein
MNSPRLIAICFCVLAIFPAYSAAAESGDVEQLRWVENADPVADAMAAIEQRNVVLLGVRGYTWIIPGVEESQKWEYREKFGLRLIKGTDDVVLGPEHQHLIQIATKYAEIYNRYVLSHTPKR